MTKTRIGIIGSGVVGQALGKGFVKSGYEVMIGTREQSKLKDWMKEAGPMARTGSNADAAKFGDIVVFCTKWEGAKQALDLAGKENFVGKIIIDTMNPLHAEPNKPPVLSLVFPQSSGKTLQEWLPESKVVKCFNIVTASYMCNPKLEEGTPDMFMCGNDATAKQKVAEICKQWGWRISDLGDISQSYLTEGLAMLWIHYGFINNHWTHAFQLLKK